MNYDVINKAETKVYGKIISAIQYLISHLANNMNEHYSTEYAISKSIHQYNQYISMSIHRPHAYKTIWETELERLN